MLSKVGGIALVLGNLLFILNKFNEMSRMWLGNWMADVISGEDIGLILIGQLALITGYIALYRHARASRTGPTALRVLCGGGILLAIGHISFMQGLSPWAEALFALVLLGVVLLVTGLIWFGLANLRQPVLRPAWLPLVSGILGGIGFFGVNTEETRSLFLMFRTLFGLGLMAIGVGLYWAEHSGGKPAPTASV